MTELVDELLPLDFPLTALRALVALGVPQDFALQLAGAGDLHVAQVDVGPRSGLFEWGGPDRRLILSVWQGEHRADLAALSSTCEDEWALRRGAADLLGMDWIERAGVGLVRELRLFATPMAWLRGRGEGLCVLDWNRGALGALRGLGSGVTLIVDNGAKAKLQALLTHGGLPLVAEEHQLRRAA